MLVVGSVGVSTRQTNTVCNTIGLGLANHALLDSQVCVLVLHTAVATLPVIESFPSTMTVEEGLRVEFKVSVSGNPNPSYQWYHNNQLVEEDYAHEVTDEGSLIVMTAEQKHNGTYKLVAQNLAGVAEKSLMLIVIKEEGTEDAPPVAANGVSTSVPIRTSLDAIPVADFGQYVANCHADNNKGFRSLYSVSNTYETLVMSPSPSCVCVSV